MAERYTDRDCYAALVRVAAAVNRHGEDYGVDLPTRGNGWKELEDLARRLEVPIRRWGDETIKEGPRFILDHCQSAYGGGVRPAYCSTSSSGENTPQWWVPSAGLGPGAKPRREFCEILSGVERALDGIAVGEKVTP